MKLKLLILLFTILNANLIIWANFGHMSVNIEKAKKYGVTNQMPLKKNLGLSAIQLVPKIVKKSSFFRLCATCKNGS